MRSRKPAAPRRFSVLIALCTICSLQTIDARAETLTMEEYLSRIGEAKAYLEKSEGTLESEEIAWLKEHFPKGIDVQSADGGKVTLYDAPISKLREEARENPEGRERLISYFKALSKQLSSGSQAAQSATDNWTEHRKRLEEIYSDPEFRHLKKKSKPFWVERLSDFIKSVVQWLKDHLPSLGRIRIGGIEYVMYVVIIVAGIFLLLWIIRSFGPTGWRKKSPTISTSSFQEKQERHWRSWRQEAFQQADRGAFREAIRCLFVSVLLEGHQNGWWIYEPHTTNREHLRRIEERPKTQRAFKELMEIYERAWYGIGQPDREDYEACRMQLEEMEAAA